MRIGQYGYWQSGFDRDAATQSMTAMAVKQTPQKPQNLAHFQISGDAEIVSRYRSQLQYKEPSTRLLYQKAESILANTAQDMRPARLSAAPLLLHPLPPPNIVKPHNTALISFIMPRISGAHPIPKTAIYGYSFWRMGARGFGLAPAGQYGGSQSGLIATYRLADATTAPALLWRTSYAPAKNGAHEFAIGARIQPFVKIPASLSVERRFISQAPDSFALYIAGGKADIALGHKFTLSSYAQAGFVQGKNLKHFFDANVHVDHVLLNKSALTVHIGAGAWSGGQTGIARLDIGPSLRTVVPLGTTKVRVDADWRFRVAGNAIPGNGPALTVSTSF